jgi:hypothetical protein
VKANLEIQVRVSISNLEIQVRVSISNLEIQVRVSISKSPFHRWETYFPESVFATLMASLPNRESSYLK